MHNQESKSGYSKRIIRITAFFINKLAYLIIGAIILINLMVYLPACFNYQTYSVISGSMEPEIKVNSLIYVQKIDPEKLVSEDIITFNSNNGIVTHRVITNDLSAKQIITKGDANYQNDLRPVNYNQVIGIVKLTIPYIGYYLIFISSLSGKIITIALLIVSILLVDISKKYLK
ncbi:MAG: signal peptidase I [Thomasclavelia sp.]